VEHAWTLRPIELVGENGGPDIDAAFAVVEAHNASIGLSGEDTRASVLGALRSPEADVAGSLLAFDDEGRAAGYQLVEVDRPARQVFLDPYSDPGLDAQGDLLSALVSAGVERAAHLVGGEEPVWKVCAGARADDQRYVVVMERNGFEVVRHFFRMRIDLDSAAPLEPPLWRDGVTVETADTADIRHAVYEVLEEAFVDHWNHAARTFDEWVGYFDATPEHVDLSQWVLVRVDGEPAAAMLGDLSLAQIDEGYIRELGTRRAFRGRGLARALLLHSFAEARRRGWRSLQLGVDSESPTGAVGLYESVGMAPAWRALAMQRDVPS